MSAKSAAVCFYRKIANRHLCLKGETYKAESLPGLRTQINRLCSEYQRSRGNCGFDPLVARADRICQRLQTISSFNPDQWTVHRRGRQFSQLEIDLVDFWRLLQKS